MCGRMNVIDDPVAKLIFDLVGLRFYPQTNRDLRPTQQVATVADIGAGLQQLDTVWGIRPSWAKRPLINAAAETVAEKKTFKQAFAARRCVVPCSGWYEWRNEGGARKQRYAFVPSSGNGFLMAAIWYPGDADKPQAAPELVTLTTEPTPYCADYHHRMPLLVPPENLQEWLQDEPSELGHLLHAPTDIGIKAEK